jgi:hypothetical protein
VARLPVPGSDDGTWGQVLNDFLVVAHDSDGTLKAGAVDPSALQDGSVSNAKLSVSGGSDGQVLTKDSLSGGGIKWAPSSGASPATSSSLGTVQLAGDLGGAATAPTVPALTSKVDVARTITAGTGLTGGGDLSANRTISASFGATAGTIAEGNHAHTLTFSLTAFYKSGTLVVTTGSQRLPVDGTYTIIGTRLTVGTAPMGAGVIVDINKNGTSIYTTQANRPSIAAAQNAGGPGATPDVTSLVAGDYLTVDIDQVGSTVAGADLTVAVIVSKTL